MIVLDSLTLTNIGVHKNTQVQLRPGISVFRGRNKSGKSTIWAALHNLLFARHPLDAAKNQAKNLLGDSGEILGEFSIDSHTYSLKQYWKGSSVSYEILKDNVDLRIRKKAKEQIVRLFGVSEEQFSSVISLSAYRPLPLLYGSSVQRKDFFDGLFDLSIYDRLQEWFASKKSVSNKAAVRLSALKQQLQEIPNTDIDVEKTSLRVKKLRSDLENLQNDNDKRSEAWSKLDSTLLMLKQRTTKYDYDTLFKKRDQLNEQYKQKRAEYEAAIAQEKERKLLLQANEIRRKIQSKLDRMDRFDESECNDKIADLKYQLSHAQTAKAEWDEYNKNLRHNYDTKKVIRELGFDPSKKVSSGLDAVIQQQIEETKSQLLRYERALKNSSNDHKCSLCFQNIDNDLIAELKSTAQDKLSKLKKKLKVATLYLSLVSVKEPTKRKSSESDIQKSLDLWMERKKQAIRYRDLSSRLKGLPQGTISGIRLDMDSLSNESSKLEKELRLVEKDVTIAKHVGRKSMMRGFKRSNELARQTKQQLEDTRKRISSLSSMVHELSVQLESNRVNKSMLEGLEKSIAQETLEAKDVDLYNELTEMFGARGLRVQAIETLAKQFCENLNIHAEHIFTEPIEFFVTIDSSRFDITAKRNNKVSDVRYLSGSESRCFQLLCLLALLPFIPARQRTDFVILDEMDSGLDQYSRRMFSENFLPLLNSMVPKVVIITPLGSNELSIETVNEYEVVKTKGIASLKNLNQKAKQ